MSTQNRTKASTRTPVSAHPLFPAIVALWFGALFGLGSLAVRASLIESLVISSHIDVIVPMAAPPLGMTARILLALFMSVIGIGAGAAIARRIARPKPVVPNRRRTGAAIVGKGYARRGAYATGSQAQADDLQYAAEKVDAVRRRALTAEAGDHARLHEDVAPLPGGNLQILDVTQFDLAEPGSFEADLPKDAVGPADQEAPLDLTGFAAPKTVQAELPEPVAADAGTTDQPTGIAETYGDDTDSFRAKFANEKKPAEWAPEPPPGYALPATAEADDEPGLEAQAPDFGPGIAFPASPRRFDPFPEQAAELFASELPRASEPSVAVAPPLFSAAPFLPEGSAAERIASAELAELSSVELIERFALALKQRRHTGAFPTGLAETAAAFDLPVRSRAAEAPDAPAEAAPLAEPVASSAPGPVLVAPSLFAAATAGNADAGDAPSAAISAQLTLPTAMRPIEFGEHEDHDDLPGYVPPRTFSMPRQADAADQASEPAEMPAENAPEAATPILESAMLDAAAADTETEPDAEGDVQEQGYSSLLALSKPAALRQPFVRIEEPESGHAQVEPVVIFPGQAMRSGMRFARPDDGAPSADPQAEAPAAAAEATQAVAAAPRRFDAPGASATAAAPVQDPAEAERALRSALATLQRMSGAA